MTRDQALALAEHRRRVDPTEIPCVGMHPDGEWYVAPIAALKVSEGGDHTSLPADVVPGDHHSPLGARALRGSQ